MRPVTTFVRPLTADERRQLNAALRAADAFTLRRAQILSASAGGQAPSLIARNLGCTARSVRNAVHAFAAEGLACLREKSRRPKTTRPLLGPALDDSLKHLLHQSPRAFDLPRSTWALGLVARACKQMGWTSRVPSIETVRRAIGRLGVSWRRAKHWITSPDPAYARKKKPATG
jgi:transposase